MSSEHSARGSSELGLGPHGETAALAGAQADIGTAQLQAAISERPGTQIGPYKLLQLIGEGGYGLVYLAEQESPLRRRIALKIIKLGMDTRMVVARFEAERQALAMMDHPNIARVLDGGTTETGRPYFVMELVKGVPMTQYCDDHNLTPRERLQLFISVCQAVQHAHQKGIIHRDIKPSNVLVMLQDDKPVPKVIDFGIAKAMHQRLTDKTLVTEYRAFIGTPAYMSPEQAETSGLDIDTRSDIYSLGVVLYELLTGTTPFDAETLMRAGYVEVQRVIREAEPQRPSTRISTLGRRTPPPQATTPVRAIPDQIARRRRTDLSSLSRLLRGDLDWIVMKCLEKDRTRRYETANALAMDLRRFLADEPVAAGPPSASYRFKKLIRRNRGVFIAGATVAVALIAGIAVSTWQAFRAREAESLAHARLTETEIARAAEQRQREAAEQQRKAAEAARAAEAEQRHRAESSAQAAAREAARLGAVSQFLKDMLASADPFAGHGPDLTVRSVLDNAAARLDQGSLKDQPDVEAAVRATIGKSYWAVSRPDAAERHLHAALALNDRVYGGDVPENVSILNYLAWMLQEKGQLAEAEALHQRELALARKLNPGDHAEIALALNDLGTLYGGAGDFAKSESLLSESLKMRRRLFGDRHSEVAETLNNLGFLRQQQGRLADAVQLFRESIGIRRDVLGSRHAALAVPLHNLGGLLHSMNELDEAESTYREALAVERESLGNEHAYVAITASSLASVLVTRKKLSEAESLAREALAIHQKRGEADNRLAGALRMLGNVKAAQGELPDAEKLMREALAIYTRTQPPGDSDTAWSQVLLGDLIIRQSAADTNRLEEAERLLLAAYEALTKNPADFRDQRSTSIRNLVALYEAWDKAGGGKSEQAALWKSRLPQATTGPAK